ncbi:phosphatidylcholine 1-acylhydrolase activity [Nesidiocoris tenuis]|uniref:Phosphatidylcholine 1-acylhydrolase activity n=1 Tax=Nesidiocoris tenuis TaxID=355587 RepID=A0ABN7B0W1_9HEMI|nr:phosphatidylcholine 1-acylhydrolase activity [Nesidiocoris tenuis]
MLASGKIYPVPQFTRFSMRTFIYAAFLALFCFQYSRANVVSKFTHSPELADEIRFALFTKEAPTYGRSFTINSVRTIEDLGFDPSKKTVIIIHGFKANMFSDIIQHTKNALLEYDDVNIIGVDWSYFSPKFFIIRGYMSTIAYVEIVGQSVGDMILQLIDLGMNCDNVHLVGHSLGSHVAGLAGRRLKEHHHTAGRITGLDPAGPFYHMVYAKSKLSKDDAQFVDCIHTSVCFGDRSPMCHADFYPNEEEGYIERQPDCNPETLWKDWWNDYHSFAHKFFASSINPSHKFKVQPYDCWLSGKSTRTCPAVVQMGYYADPSKWGKFYTKTTDRYPYTEDEW